MLVLVARSRKRYVMYPNGLSTIERCYDSPPAICYETTTEYVWTADGGAHRGARNAVLAYRGDVAIGSASRWCVGSTVTCRWKQWCLRHGNLLLGTQLFPGMWANCSAEQREELASCPSPMTRVGTSRRDTPVWVCHHHCGRAGRRAGAYPRVLVPPF